MLPKGMSRELRMQNLSFQPDCDFVFLEDGFVFFCQIVSHPLVGQPFVDGSSGTIRGMVYRIQDQKWSKFNESVGHHVHPEEKLAKMFALDKVLLPESCWKGEFDFQVTPDQLLLILESIVGNHDAEKIKKSFLCHFGDVPDTKIQRCYLTGKMYVVGEWEEENRMHKQLLGFDIFLTNLGKLFT